LGEPALVEKDGAAVRPSLGIPGIEADCSVQIGDGPIERPDPTEHESAVVVSLGQCRSESDRLIEVGHCPFILARLTVNPPSVAEGVPVLRIEEDRLVEIGDRLVVVAPRRAVFLEAASVGGLFIQASFPLGEYSFALGFGFALHDSIGSPRRTYLTSIV
jgi:hypothetical protein